MTQQPKINVLALRTKNKPYLASLFKSIENDVNQMGFDLQFTDVELKFKPTKQPKPRPESK
jgi:hypothetical protein